MPPPPDPLARMLPLPERVERLPGAFRLGPDDAVRPQTGSPAEVAAGRRLADRLHERTGRRPGFGAGRLALVQGGEGLPPEGFELRVDPEGVVLAGADPAGLRYGAEALAQLAPADGTVPAVRIRDAPALRRRGFLLDISRGRVPRVGTVKSLIELLSRLRYNELLLYTEHTFLFEKHPEIGAGSGGFSARDIRGLDAHGRRHQVELVPCLQTFGHLRRILEKDRYRELAESARLWSLSPEAPGAYPLLRDLLGEYLPHFASGWAHINCDEPIDLGKGRSHARAAREGPGALFASHANRVAAMVRELGKRPMIWADVLADHPEALQRLDGDIVLADWWYEPDHDFDRVQRFRDAGREFLTAAGTSSWSSLFPRLDTALPNIRGHARAAKRFGASGFLLTDWGDGGHFNLLGGSLYPLAVGAEAAWGNEDRSEDELEAAFSEHVAADPGGFAGTFAARLGRLHDAGFRHFNHSPLKTVFFETRLRSSRRVPAAAALSGTLDRLRRLDTEAERRGLPPGQTGLEWKLALDCSLLAAERGLAALRYRSRGGGDAEQDRRLAQELSRLADRQRGLSRRFRRIWLRTNRPEGIETAVNLHRNAVAALRRAARSLGGGARRADMENAAPPP